VIDQSQFIADNLALDRAFLSGRVGEVVGRLADEARKAAGVQDDDDSNSDQAGVGLD
jgi:hypothetical protein